MTLKCFCTAKENNEGKIKKNTFQIQDGLSVEILSRCLTLSGTWENIHEGNPALNTNQSLEEKPTEAEG